MTKYKPEDVKQAREYFASQGFPEKRMPVAERDISFFVMNPEINPGLKNFAFVCDGNLKDGYALGVSSEVPEQFQPFWALHEFVEYLELGRETPGRCKKALDEELKVIPAEFKPAYIPMRAGFFKDLVEYCKNNNYSPSDIKEFEASRDILNTLETDYRKTN